MRLGKAELARKRRRRWMKRRSARGEVIGEAGNKAQNKVRRECPFRPPSRRGKKSKTMLWRDVRRR